MSVYIASTTLATTMAICSPSLSVANSSSFTIDKLLEYSYNYNIPKKSIILNNSSSSNKDLTLKKYIDMYEFESNKIVSELNKALSDVKIDDTFIPNKTEKKVTLFVTSQKFRELCESGKYQEAYDLENKINGIFNSIKQEYENIGMVAFL